MSTSIYKFLIVRLSSLGDIIHTLPVVHQLKQNYPDSRVDWLVGKRCCEFLSLIGEIDNVYLPTINNLIQIQKNKYDFVIDVQGLFKSALLSKLSFGKKTIGFKNTREFADKFYDLKIDVGPLFKTSKHIVDLNLELVLPLLNKQLSKVKFLIPKITESCLVEDFQISKTKKSIIIFPATTWKSKLWPLNYWYELICELADRFQIYLCASKLDMGLIENLINKLDSNSVNYKNLSGKTTTTDLIYLIQNSNLVIGMDSFGLHLTSAIKNDFGFPEVIGIYGPTSPKRSGPYSQIENCLYLSELECIACRKKICPLGHHACMNKIVPDYVLEMINSKLSIL